MLDFYYDNPMEKIDFAHTISTEPKSTDFHMHDRFEIYFFISGNISYFVDKKVYNLKGGDLLVLNSSEIHKPYFISKDIYERIVIHFDPYLARLLSPPDFDLLQCFTGRPNGEQNKIELGKSQAADIAGRFKKIEDLYRNATPGSNILKLSYFIELLVYINRIFLSGKHTEEHPNIPEKLVPIFEYIDENLASDLSLKALEGRFYINRFYLSRLFKKATGINIHEFILYKRISKAKELLSDMNVTEVCQAVGFNDYSNFIRSFKSIVGVPPGKYRNSFPGSSLDR